MDRLGKVLTAYGLDPTVRSPVGAGWEVAQRWKYLAEEHLFFFCAAVLLPPERMRLGMEPMTGPLAKKGRLYKGGPEVDLSFHQELCRFFDEEGDSAPLVHLEAPRDHFKTTLLVHGRTLRELCRRPSSTFLLVGATMQRQASPYLEVIRRQIEQNDILKCLWPHMRKGKPWSGLAATIGGRPFGVAQDSITATGEGGKITGIHVDRIICDDICVEGNTGTRLRAEKTIQWFRMAPPMVVETGQLELHGTRYKDYDVHGFLRHDDELNSMFNVLRRSWSVCYDDEGEGTLDFDNAHYLFPEEWNPDKCRARFAVMGLVNFSAQFLNDPLPPEAAVLQQDWIDAALYEDDKEPKVMSVYMAMDPSLGDGRDECAIYVVGIDAKGGIWLLHQECGKWTLRQQAERYLRIWAEFNPIAGVVECMGVGAPMEQMIREIAEQKEMYPYIEYIKWQVNKEARIHAVLQPVLEGKRLHIAKQLDNVQLLEQMVRFPKGAYDDRIDALTMAIDCAIRFGHQGRAPSLKPMRTDRKDRYRDIVEGNLNLSREELQSGKYFEAVDALEEQGRNTSRKGRGPSAFAW